MNKIKIGTVQVNNSFSGQNYLPLSLGFLYSHAKEYASNFDDYEFLNPIYKRVPVRDAVEVKGGKVKLPGLILHQDYVMFLFPLKLLGHQNHIRTAVFIVSVKFFSREDVQGN